MEKRVFFICALVILSACLLPVSCKRTSTTDKIELQVYSNPFGHTTYVLSFALAEIINKNSSRLHVTCVESKGSAANILYLQGNPAALKNTLVVANPFAVQQAAKADPPFKKPFIDLKAISMIGNMCSFFITTDPTIKTIEDLAGKKLTLGPKGITLEYIPRFILQNGYDIWEKIGHVGYTSLDGIKNALIDGTTDAGIMSSVMWGEKELKDWAPIPATEELLATKKCFLLDINLEAYKKAREATGYPIYALKAKSKAFGKSDAFGGNRIWWSNSWWVHESMDDEVVKEVCSIMYDHAREFVTYHANGQAISPESLSGVAVPAGDFHPAAREFYESKGLKVGQE